MLKYNLHNGSIMLPKELQQSLVFYSELKEQSNIKNVKIPSFQAKLFHCLQARNTLGYFNDINFSIELDSLTEWQLDKNAEWNMRNVLDTQIMWAEKYCIEHCDEIVIKNQELLEWIKSKGWRISKQNKLNKANKEKNYPLISICIPYYNHGKYLEEALNSLEQQSYANFQCIIVNDGSTDAFSIETLEKCKNKFHKRFEFYSQANAGPSIARNYAATKARGEYITFFDSDNIAKPFWLETLYFAITNSNLDVVGSHFEAFSNDKNKLSYRYAPIGADLVSATIENTIGDVSIILKKTLFNELEGFALTRHGCEDWEFLVRLNLLGYTYDVIPEALFLYRHTQSGMCRTMSLYHSRMLVMNTYAKHLPAYAGDAFKLLLLPLFAGHGGNAVIIRTMLRLGIWLEERYLKMFPAGSKGQRFLSSAWYKCSDILKMLKINR